MSYQGGAYVPPPLRCFKCQRFGHVAAICRGKPRCGKCGGEDHEYCQCKEGTSIKCCNCGGEHSAAYKGCEVHKRAAQIQRVRVEDKVTYAEAIKKVVAKRGAGVASGVGVGLPEQSQNQNSQNMRNNSRAVNKTVEGVCRVCVVDGWFTASPGLSQTDWTLAGWGCTPVVHESNHGTQDKPAITHTHSRRSHSHDRCTISSANTTSLNLQ